jgi:hypothetical protein
MSDYVSPGPGNMTTNGSNDGFASGVGPNAEGNGKTLWMGEMEPWMDENFIKQVYQSVLNESVQVKVIRDRNSG